jgi:plasmid stability protein
MCNTCTHRFCMSTMIQIRHVPDAMHRELKSRAALEGMSLSEYLLRELRLIAERPSIEEMRARLHSRPRINPSLTAEEAVRAERDSR